MSQVFTGAKGAITLDNIPILWASGIQVSQEMLMETIPQLDSLEVAEYAEGGMRVTASVTLFKTNDNGLASFGLDPINLEDILLQPEMTLTIYDSITRLPKFEISGVKFRSGTGSLDSKGVWSGNWNFVGRRSRFL